LYFGGVNGINVIDPNHVIENKNAPQIAINEILLGDLPLQSDTAYNEIQSLTLSYLQNTLSFDFSALEFSQPENNIYQYRLSGYDNNWIQSGTRHFARYANLPPGNYVFQVMAANADGFWNKQPRNIFITIIPPFWQRTWFYWLMGLLGFALLGGVFYIYTKRQQRKLARELEVQQKLEQERLRISRDLHDNVGAQLSYLITNVEWMLQHPDRLTEQAEQQRLQAMSEAGRNAILTLRQTIWAISHKSLNVDDFADRFKQFALKMLEFDKTIQVHFTEDIMPDKELSPAVALNLFRVCQEAFNNCLKHAKSKNIHIHFQSDNTTVFCFKITDDGVGFDWEQAKLKGHYGLVNMEARARETNAELNVASTIGKGTTLTIVLK
jgi:signal transduction histidine kinase